MQVRRHANSGPLISTKIQKVVRVFHVFTVVYPCGHLCNHIVNGKHYTCFCRSVFHGIDIWMNRPCNKCVVKRHDCGETIHSVLIPALQFLKYLVLLFLEILCSRSSDVEEKSRNYSVVSDPETSMNVKKSRRGISEPYLAQVSCCCCLMLFEYSHSYKFCICLLCIQSLFLLCASTILQK